ncbi:MAG: patatin-like phospholipase family protein [Rhodospirillum sp.]|nr:patatin-like phospholipase family protein [Rhodospirillum sp.]MCF8503238.1 patatin-like phospholipase family protein [Rhodospirillum sp.]
MSIFRAFATVFLAITLSACSGVPIIRFPVPEDAIATAAPYGIAAPFIRFWGDSTDPQEGEAVLAAWTAQLRLSKAGAIARRETIPTASLAVSGGGPDGAFSAGLLNGWSRKGDRPQFDLVTGISTGAIVALFAFLGPAYDDTLREIYTTHRTDDLLVLALFDALTGGMALTDASGYQDLIDKYLTDRVIDRLAGEYRKGRGLLIGTTNLDATRPVVWNIGAIAASGHPKAKTLIGAVIRASSAIPGVFPPVIIPVITAEGERRDEMHVDGGATQQVMFFNSMFSLRRIDDTLGVPFKRTLYVIVNNQLRKPYKPVKPDLLSIAGTAASSLIGGSGSGDIYKILVTTQRDGVDLRILSIPPDFKAESEEPFDPIYMKRLYDLGLDLGRSGDRWIPHPIDYLPAASPTPPTPSDADPEAGGTAKAPTS